MKVIKGWFQIDKRSQFAFRHSGNGFSLWHQTLEYGYFIPLLIVDWHVMKCKMLSASERILLFLFYSSLATDMHVQYFCLESEAGTILVHMIFLTQYLSLCIRCNKQRSSILVKWLLLKSWSLNGCQYDFNDWETISKHWIGSLKKTKLSLRELPVSCVKPILTMISKEFLLPPMSSNVYHSEVCECVMIVKG